jgi:hypothetical protein
MEPAEGEDPSPWSPEFEQMFVQMLVELVNTGRIVDGGGPFKLVVTYCFPTF